MRSIDDFHCRVAILTDGWFPVSQHAFDSMEIESACHGLVLNPSYLGRDTGVSGYLIDRDRAQYLLNRTENGFNGLPIRKWLANEFASCATLSDMIVERGKTECLDPDAEPDLALHLLSAYAPKWMITYGSSDYFSKAMARLLHQASELNVFSMTRAYTQSDIPISIRKAAYPYSQHHRGAGYYFWKSWIVYDTLVNYMNDGDYLLYVDVGCHVVSSGRPRLLEYFEMVGPESGRYWLLFQHIKYPEHHWTTEAIFQHFGVSNNTEEGIRVRLSGQYMGGISIIRKGDPSIAMAKTWLDTMTNHMQLFSDDNNAITQQIHPPYRENRHDQSIISVIAKTDPHRQYVVAVEDEVDPMEVPMRSDLPIQCWRTRES